jgi:hypothetical protein
VLDTIDGVNCALDLLRTIGRGLGYEDLLPHTVEMETGGGVRVRVLNLATIIALKEQLAGAKRYRRSADSAAHARTEAARRRIRHLCG